MIDSPNDPNPESSPSASGDDAVFAPPELPTTVGDLFALLKHPWAAPPARLPPRFAAAVQPAISALLQAYAHRVKRGSGFFKQLWEGVDGRYYLGGDIPAATLQNARAAMFVPPGEPVLALYDFSWGGKNGVVFSELAIYWNLPFGDVAGPLRIDYPQLMRCPILWDSSPECAFIGNPFTRSRFITNSDKKSFYELLLEIQNTLYQKCGLTDAG